jgi:PAS domain S-box-containing protein
MIGVGDSGLIAGVLQLSVPSYALRLVHRFGTQRVGWFVVTAFISLAFLHLLGPAKPAGTGLGSAILMDTLYAGGSVLLIIGMCHVENLFAEQERVRSQTASLRSEWESRFKEESANLARANQGLVQEIAQRDQIVEALKASEAHYRFLFVENPQPMWILDLRSCRFLAVNSATLRQYGFTAEEFMTLTGRDLLLPVNAAGFLEDISKPCPAVESRGVWQHCKKDGTLIDVELSAVDLTFGDAAARLFLATDITERRRREMDLRKVHKMETVGHVAGGVAHHLNNILTIIEGNASILMEKPLDLQSAEKLEHISSAVMRAAGITRQLLAAGARQSLRLESLDLNGLIRSLNPMLRRLIGEHIALESSCAYLPQIHADRRLLEHVIINLVLNARDAMSDGGVLTIGTARVRIDDDKIETGHPGKTGEFVRLSISDTGCGMTPQIESRLFEPFFTTREQGLGLGLASVFGIVKQHSGWVEYTTDAGSGTEFRVFLPATSKLPETAQPAEAAPAKQAKATVLLVEPEDRARTLAHFVLNRHGYKVIEADCGATALVLWDSQATDVDLLFTNLILPGDISGRALAERFQQSKPGLKVVYSVDQNPGADEQAAIQPEGMELVSKPFGPDKLIQVIRSSLGAA